MERANLRGVEITLKNRKLNITKVYRKAQRQWQEFYRKYKFKDAEFISSGKFLIFIQKIILKITVRTKRKRKKDKKKNKKKRGKLSMRRMEKMMIRINNLLQTRRSIRTRLQRIPPRLSIRLLTISLKILPLNIIRREGILARL